MKDNLGIYYFPTLQNKQTRMYVREEDGEIQFRMWNSEHPELWERHGWLSMTVVEKAAEMYKERGTDRNPMALYDINVARKLIQDERGSLK